MTDAQNPNDVEPLISDDEMGRRIVEQAFELWINPEIERRVERGEIDPPIQLFMAQVVWPPEGPHQVRLNSEVKGHAWTRMNRPIEKGEPVLISDLEGFAGFELEEEELDCGHLTLMSNGKGWVASFNFLRKRARGLALLEKAEEFLVAAREALGRGHAAVVIDNLFSACELASKADLLTGHFIEEKTSHKAIHSALNNQKRLGNVDAAFVDLFNRLSRLRPFYRYASEVSDQAPIEVDDVSLVSAVTDRIRSKLERLSKEKLEHDPMIAAIKLSQ